MFTNSNSVWTPVIGDDCISLGLATRNVRGFQPSGYRFQTWGEAQDFADAVNTKLGFSREAANEIITSSMTAK